MKLTGEETAPRVERSLAVELGWALFAAEHNGESSGSGALCSLFEATPELQTRSREMWGDGFSHSAELLLLAERAGVLFETELEPLLAGLPAGLAAVDGARLATETAEERSVALGRLARLRESPVLLRRYLDLLAALWAEAAGEFERVGRDASDRAARYYRERLAQGASWRELVGNPVADALFPAVLEKVPAGLPVVVVPSYYFGKMLVVDLGGFLLVAGPAAAVPGRAQENAELARRLRAIGHPTRLGILATLAQRSASVGDLAAEFGVAQPTLTNHLRLLRDAGLVRSDRHGTRLQLSVDEEAFDQVLRELGSLTETRTGPPPP